MDTITINEFIIAHQKKNIFKGVYPCDRLPSKFTLPAVFVVNLSKHDEPGTHWIAIFINKNGVAFYFDSFGFDIRNDDIRDFLKKKSKRILHNKKQLQHISSNKCGLFCCAFAIAILKECSIEEFLNKFSVNLFINDRIIDSMYDYLKK